jgi:hypothetical protein
MNSLSQKYLLVAQPRTLLAKEIKFSGLESHSSKSRARGVSRWLRALRYPLVLAISILLFCAGASAQAPPGSATPPGTTPANPCDTPNKSLADTAKCLKHIYDKVTKSEGVHLVTGAVVPGSGFAAGIGYGKTRVSEKWRMKYESSARVSFKKYWEIDTNLRLTKSSNTFSSDSGPTGDLKINLYGLVKDMRRLDFFGIGPNSREQDRAVFHYDEGVIGADISKPVAPAFDVGGAFETILTRIVFIKDPTVRSVERVFSDANAPGINTQPTFLHFVAFAGLHSTGQPESRMLDYKFFYHFYQDVEEHRFSFRRFDADLKHKFPFGKNEVRIRGRLSFAETKDLQRVPFYLMQTLGGSNISNDDTLRGFRDYRFRDRDLALLQLEYLRTVYGPINLIGFYDTGKVAPSISRFDEGRLRHTFGLGLVVVPRRGDNVLFRFYVAFGSGEGMHTYAGLGDLLGGRPDRLVR